MHDVCIDHKLNKYSLHSWIHNWIIMLNSSCLKFIEPLTKTMTNIDMSIGNSCTDAVNYNV